MPSDTAASATARVLLVAPDGAWRAAMAEALEQAWFVVARHADGEFAQVGPLQRADLAIVDLGLRSPSGVAVCSSIRMRSSMLLMAVAADAQEDDIIDAFTAGADGYLPMSASPRVLLARARGLLRRSQNLTAPAAGIASFGDLTIDVTLGEIRVNGEVLALRPAEHELIEALVVGGGRVVSRTDLAARLSVIDLADGDLDLLLRRVREQLEQIGSSCRVRTVRKVGVRLEVEADSHVVTIGAS